MRELAGRHLGTYRLVEQTAVGGMAVIFKAYDESLDRYVAIKILPDYLSRDADFSARFRNEARNVARLRHPNILPIFGYGEEDGLSYFVMDLVEGGTLKELMGTPLPVGRVEELIGQIAGALNYAHEQGVVHRDVKPSNVLMLRPDWALLSDFGIARVLEQTANVTHTGSAFFGTPHYMAPEQARGEQVTAQTDQYALGIVLYEMLTGETPYRADTPQAVVYQHIYSPPPPPHEKNPSIPEPLEAVILRALAKDPAERYPSMAAFADAVHVAMHPGSPSLLETSRAEPAQAQPTPEAFPPGGATPAFRPAATATKGTTGPFTERIEVAPAPEPEPEPAAPVGGGRRIPRWWWGAGGIAAVVVVAVIALFALRGGGSSAPTARVALLAPVPVSNYSIQDSGGHTVATGGSTSSSAHVRLSPGSYSFTPLNVEGLILPVPFTVSSAKAQTIDLRPRYGRLSITPPAGLVSVPGLDVVRGSQSTGVDSTAATQGFYVAPGRYTIGFYPSDYPLTPAVTIRAGKSTALDLSRIYGRLALKPLAGAPASGLNVNRRDSGATVTDINAAQARGGVYLPSGAYSLVFYSSDAYVDPIPAIVRVGASTTLDLNTILAAVHVPAAPLYTLSYNWREGGSLRTITAKPKPQTVYILAGTYRMEILRGGATRVVTVRAPAGSTVSLPDR
jgi:serine/threonine-protein kinase